MKGMMRLNRLLCRSLHLGDRVKGRYIKTEEKRIFVDDDYRWYLSYQSFWDNLSISINGKCSRFKAGVKGDSDFIKGKSGYWFEVGI